MGHAEALKASGCVNLCLSGLAASILSKQGYIDILQLLKAGSPYLVYGCACAPHKAKIGFDLDKLESIGCLCACV